MTEFAAPGSSPRSLGAFDLFKRAARFDEEQDASIGQRNRGPLAAGQQPGA
jgi:hypothetical protein